MRDDLDLRYGAPKKTSQQYPQFSWHQEHGRQSKSLLLRGCSTSLAHQRIDQAGLDARCIAGLGVHRLQEDAFEPGLQRHDLQLIAGRIELFHNRPAQCNANQRRQIASVLHLRAMFDQYFNDGAHIPNVNTFVQQALKHLLHSAKWQQFRHQVFDQFG